MHSVYYNEKTYPSLHFNFSRQIPSSVQFMQVGSMLAQVKQYNSFKFKILSKK